MPNDIPQWQQYLNEWQTIERALWSKELDWQKCERRWVELNGRIKAKFSEISPELVTWFNSIFENDDTKRFFAVVFRRRCNLPEEFFPPFGKEKSLRALPHRSK